MYNDKPQYIQTLQHRFGIDRVAPLDQPTLRKLDEMAGSNAYHSLEYYFNSSTFTNIPNTHRLRTIHSIMSGAHQSGHTRVIKLCADNIKAITSNVHGHQEQVLDIKMQVEPCSRQLERVVHSVFGDRKLGMLIMEQVGVVHKSLSVDVIKGAQLIDRHCLNDYIKYGATEWFLKAYSRSSLSNKDNNDVNQTLLYTALTKCRTEIVEVLLANPKMTLKPMDNCVDKSFFDDMSSSCTHPAWEKMFDQFIAISFGDAPFNFFDGQLSLVQHPSYFRKLIQCGVKFDPFTSFYDIENIIHPSGWLHRPWAIEMIQLLEQYSLLGHRIYNHLCLTAIEHNITPVVQYLFDQSPATWFDSGFEAYELFNQCLDHGYVEFLDRLPMVDIALSNKYLTPTSSGETSWRTSITFITLTETPAASLRAYWKFVPS
ncbi:hypothetical protein SAMD00019534_101090 [Acytostelium subglobosum LB1]|uniref:hypothetical protein n=1 Tax=Acytostelium subglobosum LB1 TaxID=1410327 RepID=UPI000644C6FD|nr:hypothetical protein SAMD00019534_101090 [Acytostelium subglobosum LB1]GAM26934.1 hypothetical protein SAMD00019534_101090 [Acytostelium subglobosum LB1]|eukprot:XP_012750202.1 hypothetical protein SAMD00019534_101090 [Acytostelium subglobosum LB1]